MTALPRFPRFVRVSDRTAYRWLEALPGLAVWSTFAIATIVSLVAPMWAIVFILLFDVYWIIRVLYVMSYLIMAYRKYRREVVIDWHRNT
jgi:hypothetical protein